MENSFAAVNYGQVNTTTNNGAGQRTTTATTTTKRNQQQVEVDVGIENVNKERN